MVEQLVKLPKTVSEDGIQQRTVERTIAQVAEELEVSKVFPKVNSVLRSNTTDTRGVYLAAKIVEGPVTQTQQVVYLSVEHDVNTLEVEKHIIQEKINQVTRHVETPLLQTVKKTLRGPRVALHREGRGHPCRGAETIRMNRNVQKTIEILQLQHTDDVVDVLVVLVVVCVVSGVWCVGGCGRGCGWWCGGGGGVKRERDIHPDVVTYSSLIKSQSMSLFDLGKMRRNEVSPKDLDLLAKPTWRSESQRGRARHLIEVPGGGT